MRQPQHCSRYGLRFLFTQTAIVAIGLRVGLSFPEFAEAMCILYLWVIMLQFAKVFRYKRAAFLHLGTMLVVIVLRFAPCYTTKIVDCWIAPYLLGEAALVGLFLSIALLSIDAIRRLIVRKSEKILKKS